MYTVVKVFLRLGYYNKLITLLEELLANYNAEVINDYIALTYVGHCSDPHSI